MLMFQYLLLLVFWR